MADRDALEEQVRRSTAEPARTPRPPAITVTPPPAPIDLDHEQPAPDWTVLSAWRANRSSVRIGALIVVATATLSAALGAVPIAAAVAVAALVPAALVDVVDRRLPDRLVAGAAAILVTVALASSLVGPVAWRDAVIGALLFAGPLLILHLASPDSMGFGDVKAATVLGAGLGFADPQLALVALTAASAGAAGWGLIRRQRSIAFGPALVAGSALVLACGPLATGGDEPERRAATTIEVAR